MEAPQVKQLETKRRKEEKQTISNSFNTNCKRNSDRDLHEKVDRSGPCRHVYSMSECLLNERSM